MNALLLLPTVLTFALADAPRSAALLQEASGGGGEATPIVESIPSEQPALVEQPQGTTAADAPPAPASASSLASTSPRPLLAWEAEPARVWLGGVVGGLGVLVGGVAGIAVGLQAMSTRSDSIGLGGVVYAAIGAVVGAWVVGPLAAGLAMGGWRVPGRVLLGAVVGLLAGMVSTLIPAVGILTLLAGPTVGVVYAVASAPAEDLQDPPRARVPAAPGPLLAFHF